MILGERSGRGLVVCLTFALAACGHGGGGGGGDHDGPDAAPGGCPQLAAPSGSGDATGSLDGLVPAPRQVVPGDGSFALTAGSAVVVRDEAARAPAQVLADRLAQATGYTVPLVGGDQESCFAGASTIVFTVDASLDGLEAYRVRVEPAGITVSAAGADGFARGVATLRQLFAAEVEGAAATPRARWLVPAVTIDDAATFRYRGIHLDVSRHFFSLAFLERYVDLLSAYKLNTFHLHLTDDQGWRMEILKYPRLTDVGGFRQEAGGRYGGFYTQAELRELVAYAAARGVTVVPEIELPGHATAALAAYPEYACVTTPLSVATTWGVFENVYCPSEETFTFLEDVLTEVMDVFPSQIIHIGGDEVPITQWQASSVAQAVISREGLSGPAELEAYFVRRIEAFLHDHGRTAIGWDEIVADGVPAETAVMAWRSAAAGRAAAEAGHDVVMTPNDTLYFDHYQADPATEPFAIGGYATVADVYGFEPLPAGIGAAAAAHIVGAQANLWSEYVTTEEHAEYMLLPRALALAEVLWADDPARDYADFVKRLRAHAPHLDAAGVSYARHAFDVSAQAPYGGAPHAVPGTIQAEDYDTGGEGVSYRDTGAHNQAGQYRHDDVDIEATPGGGYDVGYVDAGEWLEYTVQVAAAGSYKLRFRAATPQAGASFALALDGAPVAASVPVASTGDWAVFAERTGPDVPLTAGKHVLRLTFGVGSNLDWIALDAP